MKKPFLLLILATQLLSGCASTTMAKASCDFVEGAYEKQIRVNQANGPQSNITNGLINVLLGSVNGDSKRSSQCRT